MSHRSLHIITTAFHARTDPDYSTELAIVALADSTQLLNCFDNLFLHWLLGGDQVPQGQVFPFIAVPDYSKSLFRVG